MAILRTQIAMYFRYIYRKMVLKNSTIQKFQISKFPNYQNVKTVIPTVRGNTYKTY